MDTPDTPPRVLTLEEQKEKYQQALMMESLFQSITQADQVRLKAKYPTAIPEIEAVLGRPFVEVA